MPMAGATTTPNANAGSANAATGGSGNTPAGAPVGSSKTWELSDYELHRTPQEAITDGSEIAVSPRALHSELMCPICLDMLHETMTTKECLHRFCAECIITALRSGNKECPTCRKKLVSKRSLRRDPNFDMLISKIYPSRDEYEAQQQKAMARLSKSHNQLALATSIEEGMKAQQNQNRKIAKPHHKAGAMGANSQQAAGGPTDPLATNPENKNGTGVGPDTLGAAGATGNAEPSAVEPSELSASHTAGIASNPSSAIAASAGAAHVSTNGLGISASPHPNVVKSIASRSDSVGGDNSSNTSDEVTEVELVFKPHPDMDRNAAPSRLSAQQPQMQTRFIKTSANASVEHLRTYLAMRLAIEHQEEAKCTCSIWIAPNGNFIQIPLDLTLGQICDKYWRFNKPLEVFYCFRKLSC